MDILKIEFKYPQFYQILGDDLAIIAWQENITHIPGLLRAKS